MHERTAETNILQKTIALIVLPIPAALLLLFTAGSFILMIASSLCAITASILVLSIIMLLATHAAITVQTILCGLGAVILLMSFSVGILFGKDAIEFLLMQTVQRLMRVIGGDK